VLWRFGLLVSALRPGPSDRILDFGCGTGWTSILLARMGAEVVGMDIAPAALAIASEAADHDLRPAQRGHLTFATYGGARIDAHDGSFDAVVVNDAFHHFPNPKELLAEFHRILTPHGLFGFSEPGIGHAATEHSQAERAHGVLEEDVDLEQLYRSGKAAGFDDLDVLIPALEPEALALPMDRMRLFLRGVPGVLPTDLLRNAVLTGPIGVFRKGPYRATSLHPRSHQAEIEPASRTVSARAGETFVLAVRLRNPTETVWLREGRRGIGYVRLGAHLLDGDGRELELDYGRGTLPKDVTQGEAVPAEIRLEAPKAPGLYIVRLDMVNEGVCWFAQTGSPAADVALDVRA
jgi:SAM-dependent methyltransferase